MSLVIGNKAIYEVGEGTTGVNCVVNYGIRAKVVAVNVDCILCMPWVLSCGHNAKPEGVHICGT